MKTITIDDNTINYFTPSEIYQAKNVPTDNLLDFSFQIADHISSQLSIPCPDIGYVPNLQYLDNHTGTVTEQGGRLYTTVDIPELSNNLIILSITKDTTTEKLIGELAHEMRHIWQNIYNPAINRCPAQGFIDSLTHPAEIDADGYAIYYMSGVSKMSFKNAAEIICPEEYQYYPGDCITRIKKAVAIREDMQLKSQKKPLLLNRISNLFSKIRRK